jgi:hypothetical protein
MMKIIFVIVVLVFALAHAIAQTETDSLFSSQNPLDIRLSMSIKQVQKSKEDTVYLSHKLYYCNSAGIYDSMKIGLKGRGNFRLQQCYFPPLWIKIDKKQAKGTLFEGNKKLKLVLPCYDAKGNNALILREYLCYKLYEEITPYAFKTRLANIDLTEERGKKNRTFQVKGILIEDPDKAAKRYNGKTIKDAQIHPAALHDTCSLRFDFFQFMVSNTDWSKSHQHNSKLFYHGSNYIPIPYDFDMAGLVNTPYAVVSQVGGEQLPIESVTDRYYRGHCRPHELTEFVRMEFLSKEEELLSVPDVLKGELSDKEIKEVKDYLEEFFIILKNDRLFKHDVIDRCRSL